MMELRVWVDGIPRVVSGATYDTTCQDLVVAVAHAMNRTGRFTLIEKWRNSNRPLTPVEYPLQVLQKWGEYAGEVQFILCQADKGDGKQSDKDKLLRNRGEQHVLPCNFMQPHVQDKAEGARVKRSLTFTGAYNHLPSTSVTASSASTSKFRKTQKGPVPNGDVRQESVSARMSASSLQPLPRQQRGVARSQQAQLSGAVHHPSHPVPPPRHRSSPALSRQVKENVSSSALTPVSFSPTSELQPLNRNRNTASPCQPLQTPRSHAGACLSPSPSHPISDIIPPSQPQSVSHATPHPQPQSPAQLVGPDQGHQLTSHSHHRHTTPSPPAPPLPTAPPPSQAILVSQPGTEPLPPQEKGLDIVEASLVSSDHSSQASLEIEEYDLEHNFSDTHREYSHAERPSVNLEYRLEDGMDSGTERQHDGEHAKLVQLVNTLQEQLKTQESQISLINTEITALEGKEKEYEEKLHVIMEELLLHENHQRDLELQLNDLETVEWDCVLDGEKKCEVDLTLQIASLKATVLEHEEKLADAWGKESELLSELKEEENKLKEERERLKVEEAKAREDEDRMKEEISKLQVVLTEEQTKTTELEASLSSVGSELKSVEENLGKKQTAIEDAETQLKDENLKEFVTHPVPKEDPKSLNSGETILKILEGRLSPRLPANTSSKPGDSCSPPPFMAASGQSGVWV